MPENKSTPRASDDLETSERKSKSVEERMPTGQTSAGIPETEELPGAITRGGPLTAETPGPGETVLAQESKAQRAPTVRG